MDEIRLNAIGHFHCDEQHRYELPRQSTLANNNSGYIELLPQQNFEQALSDLNGFERVWVVYLFHLNTTWKPKVRPPRTDGRKKISVFATRSPYRPNPIGISAVELVKIDGLKLHIRNFDILDESPILDIKPYLPYSDSFPDSAAGWLAQQEKTAIYHCSLSVLAVDQADFIYSHSGLDLKRFAYIQLKERPLDKNRKRIEQLAVGQYSLACRTWRIHFTLDEQTKTISIIQIKSGYSEDELARDEEDPYDDKEYHRLFIEKWTQV